MKNKKIKMTTNLVLRCNGLFNEFRKKINISKLFYIEADYIWGRKHKLFEWRSKIKEYSVTLGAAVHMIDLVLWLTKLKPISVTSFGNSKITRNSKFKKNNLIVAMLKFPKNINVKINNYRKWTRNGINILIGNFRAIPKKYKKRFNARVIVKFEND